MAMIDKQELDKAAATIRAGGLVATPTETVYGLAADATNDRAVARIFEAKGRPQFNPLIIHIADMAMAARYVDMTPLAKKLANKFWPGPLTIVAARRADCDISLLASAGLETLAVRAPNHPIAQDLIKTVGRPLAAPSANRSGAVSPTEADHARASLGGKVDMILDGGPCSIGVESTIVKVDGSDACLLRPGGVAREEIEAFLGATLSNGAHTEKPQAPGMLKSHYAPRARLRLNAKAPQDDEAFLGFGNVAAAGPYALNLSPDGNLREAAANLFAYLRRLDDIAAAQNLNVIAAAFIPMTGLGEAINDRLKRAAAPRQEA